MRALEDGAPKILGIRLQELLLDRLLGIARKEHREVAIGELADDRLVVRVVLVALLRALLDEFLRRVEDLERDAAAEVEHIAGLERLVLDAFRLELLHVADVELRRGRHAVVVDRADLVVLEEDVHAADVVGMRMRQDDLVDLLDARLVELALELVALVDIARVDEHRLLRRLDENGVTLADVEHLDRDILAGRRRRRGLCSARRGTRRTRALAAAAARQHGDGQHDDAEYHTDFLSHVFSP